MSSSRSRNGSDPSRLVIPVHSIRLATGLLPVTIGEATKLTNWLEGPKRYRALIRLGIGTDTLDAQGQVVSTKPIPGFGRR